VSGHEGAPLEMSCKCAMPTGATAAASVVAALTGRPAAPLRFGDSGMCVSLGRRDAAIHLRRRDGSDTGRIYRGRVGALIKESIVRYVTGALALERYLPTYRWLSPARQLAAAPGTELR
jgi:NADH dehydrogenase